MGVSTVPTTVGLADVGDHCGWVVELRAERCHQSVFSFDGQGLRVGSFFQTYGIPRHGRPHLIRRNLALFLLLVSERGKHQIRMSVGASRSHFRRYPDRFHELLRGRAGPPGCLRVALDAIRTLGDVSDGDSDDLLNLGWKCSICENYLAEGLKGGLLAGRQIAP